MEKNDQLLPNQKTGIAPSHNLKQSAKADDGCMNDDGSLQCFGRAFGYGSGDVTHCLDVMMAGHCNDRVLRECWKRSEAISMWYCCVPK